MAQLKDLLVTGPVRMIGDVYFNKIPKYNNINLATINDVNNVAITAANAQGRADDAFDLAESKTTMDEVEQKNYATVNQLNTTKTTILGTTITNGDTVNFNGTVKGAYDKADSAAITAANAQGDIDTITKDVNTDYNTLLKLENKIKAINETIRKLDDTYATDQALTNAISNVNISITNGLNAKVNKAGDVMTGSLKLNKNSSLQFCSDENGSTVKATYQYNTLTDCVELVFT